jgi:hypothetical protein
MKPTDANVIEGIKIKREVTSGKIIIQGGLAA